MKRKKTNHKGRKPIDWNKRDLKLIEKYAKNRAENRLIMERLTPNYKYSSIARKVKEVESNLDF